MIVKTQVLIHSHSGSPFAVVLRQVLTQGHSGVPHVSACLPQLIVHGHLGLQAFGPPPVQKYDVTQPPLPPYELPLPA